MIDVLVEGEDNKLGGSMWIGRDGDSFAMAIPLGNITKGNEASETIDR